MSSPKHGPLSTATSSSTISKECSLSSMKSETEFSDGGYFCQGPQHYESLVTQMQEYWRASQLCDVTFIAGSDGKRVQAHRIVLSAASPYFAAMFTGSLKEANEKEIVLQDVDGDSLSLLIQYCYTGQIELHENTVELLLSTSSRFQISAVTVACSNFLGRQLHPSNCLGFAYFAEQQGCQSLLSMAHAYICQNFMQVSRNQEFFDLNKDQIADLLRSEDLNVPSEQDVFFALISWVEHNPSERKAFLSELLANIKLPLLQPSFIIDHIESLGDANECQKLIMEAMKWHLLPERRSQISSSRTRPRKSTMGRLLAIGGMDGHKGPLAIESYDPRLNEWSILKNMPARRLQCGVALMDNKMVVVGGRDGLKTLNSVEAFNLSTMTWSTLPSMNTHRHGLGVAVLNGPLYAVGGHDGWSYLNTVERFDPIAKQWTFVAAMSSLRSTAGVAVLDDKLYVVGGRDGTVCHRSVECFDPHTNKWVSKAQMSRRRGGVGVGVCNGYLYAVGGHDCPANNPAACRTETVERYDPATDTWTLIASLNIGRDGIAVSVLGDSILCVGGYDGNSYLRLVEKYDPEENKWAEQTPVTFPRAGGSVVAIPNVYSATVTTSSSAIVVASLST